MKECYKCLQAKCEKPTPLGVGFSHFFYWYMLMLLLWTRNGIMKP